MRQRLLLVAGWAAAAVVASLVSTGAVAVAGGQVTDRPLRPLSASEVAALTEECGSTERAPCLRQLDYSADPTTSVSAAPELNSSPEGGEDGVSPLLPPDATTEAPSEDPLDPAVEVDESLLPPSDDAEESTVPEPRAQVVDLTGGRVSVSGAEGEVRIIWLIPRHGFAVLPASGADNLPDHVTVVLSDGSHQSTLIASWDSAEGLVIEIREGGLDFTES
ncbi:MAG: hypothetical protein QNJ81_12970 [Acidimicrobiia bacterium]|nr:hypothetical protein [Acidimicrobiia bacterium]